ncbi:uncharacterized protein LOC120067643 [Benincasa hispida]|uniref:uncharacterized protein LOC120067643 n=1 Tax=Benincasa hispida TaxID=102211 RepID=UPI00190152A7|nr:uncharacterized protein LOC120067643 [Benincasa hispida]
MDRRTFVILCNMLRTISRSAPTQCIDMQEMVAIFLHILVHDVKNRVVGRKFAWSGETVSRHFRFVLTVVLQLHELLLKKPEPITSDCTDSKWKWFENCLGALDDTYIKVNVSAVDRTHYRTRKGEIATNVLAICSPTAEFIFVLPRWERSVANSRVLRDAISRPHGLKVSKGIDFVIPFSGFKSK